jgi:hypothetical protein
MGPRRKTVRLVLIADELLQQAPRSSPALTSDAKDSAGAPLLVDVQD